MKILLTDRNNKTTDITSIVPSLEISGDLLGASRILNFSYVYSSIDTNIFDVAAETGDLVQIFLKNKLLFYGHIFIIDKATGSNAINATCYDYGIYLKKNQHSYGFKSITPEAAVKKICSDFDIEIGDIANTGISISRNYFGTDLYSIIIGMFYQASLVNGKKYMLRFAGKKLNVIEKGDSCTSQLLQSGFNILTSNISESIDNMVNAVALFNSSDDHIDTVKNDDDIKLYGMMQSYLKIDGSEAYNEKAKFMLKGAERKISVTSFGNTECITGNTVIIKEPVTKLYGMFYIDNDVHSWKNGIYTNKLVLNFQNIMDENDVGEIEAVKAGTKDDVGYIWIGSMYENEFIYRKHDVISKF